MKIAYCFDFDGTISKKEVLPLIAENTPYSTEIRDLTRQTIFGEIPFEQSFVHRVNILKKEPLEKIHNIIRGLALNEEILSFINSRKEECHIVTGNLDAWIYPVAERIQCKIHTSTASMDGDSINGVAKVLDKGEVVRKLRASNDLIVSVGDGMGDVAMFEESDLSVAFGACHPPVKELVSISSHITYSETSLCRFLKQL